MGNIQFINAGAGSGKTYTLTKKFCELLADGAKPSEFILTTYTKAAADEFRSKIKARLLEEGMTDVLPLVESAHIGTIHSVAQSYIEKYWYLLNMSPSLAVKEKDDMKAFISRTLDSVAEDEDITFFDTYCSNLNIQKRENGFYVADPGFWRELVLELVDKMRLYGFDGSDLENFKKSSLELVKELFPTYSLNKSDLSASGTDLLNYFKTIKLQKTREGALKLWEDSFKPFIDDPTLKGCHPLLKFIEKTDKWVLNAPQDLFDIIRVYALSSISEQATECIERIFAIAEKLLTKIDQYKREEGILEFSDLEVLFLELLSYESVKNDLQDSVKYVFVDEFQDVSPIQLKIFQSLSEIVDESCWVGDPKQAIYGFRGSDSSLVNSVIASMQDCVKPLEFSYRSLPDLVNASNQIFIDSFALLKGSEMVKKEHVILNPCKKKENEQNEYSGPYRAQHHWFLSVRTKSGESTSTSNSKRVYPAVAAKLKEIFKNNTFKVTDTKDDKPFVRDLKYGDVAILTRKNDDCIRIANALRAKGLPVSVLDSVLKNQAEIKLIISLMKYISRIDTELSVAELRRLMLDDDIETILLGLANQNECKDLLQLLDVLRNRYQHHSVYDIVKELIAVLDLRHVVCKWSMGQKRQANLDLLVSMASTFVKRQKEASVLEFINYLADRKLDVPFDNTGDTIKVLSYHKSKGLQWKMVILDSLYLDSLEEGDFMEKDFSNLSVRTTSDGKVSLNLFPPVSAANKLVIGRIPSAPLANDLWEYLKEKKRAEELRLLYVGFTRAENYLVHLSFGAVPLKWLDNTNVAFDKNILREEICDDSTSGVAASQKVSVLPYVNVVKKVEGPKKYISPSQREADSTAGQPSCHLEKIAENIDVPRGSVQANVFGTCIHNYMAVHRWSPDGRYQEMNVRNAARVLEGFCIETLIDAEKLVGQADAFFAYVEKNFGEVDVDLHEIPFTDRRGGQVITGEIDLYVKTRTGEGILMDFKNPVIGHDISEQSLKIKAINYWPQLEAYRNALSASGYPVTHIYIYYPLIGLLAELNS